jgi:hypothetical protein
MLVGSSPGGDRCLTLPAAVYLPSDVVWRVPPSQNSQAPSAGLKWALIGCLGCGALLPPPDGFAQAAFPR